jgi:hypothetical protein
MRLPGWPRPWLVPWLAAALLGAPVASADDGDPDPDLDDPHPLGFLSPERREPGAEAPEYAGLGGMPAPEELERRGATIGQVHIRVQDIFDKNDPRENYLVYRLADDLHYDTRKSTVEEQLLFRSGEPYSVDRTAETARNLRERNYFSDADVQPVRYHADTNTVDLDVRVHDVWTLEPGVGVGRSGGTNKSRIRLADENFLGFGNEIAVEYKSNVDRSGLGLHFNDPNVFHSRWATSLNYTDTSDGQLAFIELERPFFSLDTRWSLGFAGSTIDEITPVYEFGEKVSEFESHYRNYSVQGGVSDGLVGGWTERWLAGYRYDSAKFDPVFGGEVPTLELPEDRVLSYPWVGIELIENHYQTTANRDQIGRIEDVFLGRRMRATVGWATTALGSDRSAIPYSLLASMGVPIGQADDLQLATGWEGRLESGSLVDAVAQASSRYYHRFDEKNTFMGFLSGAHADGLPPDKQLQLGGDNGLRGYPLRYQTGDTRLLMTVEERYYTDWYPFRLFRVGGAVFADAGRMWGGDPTSATATDPTATPATGWLGDVGFGLRIGNARSGIGSVLHIDLAFPVAPPNDVDKFQLLLQAEKSF